MPVNVWAAVPPVVGDPAVIDTGTSRPFTNSLLDVTVPFCQMPAMCTHWLPATANVVGPKLSP